MSEFIRINALGARSFWDVIKDKIGFSTRVSAVEQNLAAKANAMQANWQDLTLINGATDGSDGGNNNGYTPSFHKDTLGFVRLRGLVGYDTASNGQVVAVLPVGNRPARHLFFSSGNYNLDVRPNGEIYIWESLAGAGIVNVALEFVPAFQAEQ